MKAISGRQLKKEEQLRVILPALLFPWVIPRMALTVQIGKGDGGQRGKNKNPISAMERERKFLWANCK